jgi:hypothetical protein
MQRSLFRTTPSRPAKTRIRCRPPLSEEEVIRTLDSVTHLQQLQDAAAAVSLEHQDSAP